MRMKLPAYAKRLLDDRRAGLHPLDVNLVFGDRWADVPEIKVCIKPEDYAVGVFDFHVLAGLKVTIHAQVSIEGDADPLFDLVGEVAAAQALVVIRWPKGFTPRETWAFELAFCNRFKSNKGVRWPAWWSDALDCGQQTLAKNWIADCERKVA